MRTFVFDLDGTIVTNGQPVSAPLAQSLTALAQRATVIFASARPVRDMLPLLPASLHHCLMIGCNGAMAWQQGKWHFAHTFSPAVINTILPFLQQHAIPYILDGTWQYSVSKTPHPFHDYLRTLSQEETNESALCTQGITKVLILDGNARPKIEALFQQQHYAFNLTHHKQDNFFDITPQKENKYLALKALNIPFAKLTAFGNDMNDFAMLDHAQTAVFLGDKNDYLNADVYIKTEALSQWLELQNLIENEPLV